MQLLIQNASIQINPMFNHCSCMTVTKHLMPSAPYNLKSTPTTFFCSPGSSTGIFISLEYISSVYLLMSDIDTYHTFDVQSQLNIIMQWSEWHLTYIFWFISALHKLWLQIFVVDWDGDGQCACTYKHWIDVRSDLCVQRWQVIWSSHPRKANRCSSIENQL